MSEPEGRIARATDDGTPAAPGGADERRVPASGGPVFLVDTLPGGVDTLLDGSEGYHATTVRRLRPGERVVLTDGVGGLAECAVRASTPGRLLVAVVRRSTLPAPQPRLVVVQAPPKGDRSGLAVELMTELGVDEIVPWSAERAVVRWDDAGAARATQRWRSAAREATKQTRRAWLPMVTEPHDTEQVCRRIAAAAAAVVLQPIAPRPLAAIPLPAVGDVVVVVGPEGGITDTEAEAFVAAGAAPARLGPTVLRSSTAGAAALVALALRTGRWT
jgi:16S rRNA (uracil1498-N3)-methyltransferase